MSQEDPPAEGVISAPIAKTEDTGSRASLQHVLSLDGESKTPRSASGGAKTTVAPSVEDAKEVSNQDAPQPHYTATSTTTRRNANGSVSSVYSGNKIRYLKKDDGQPLWRGDIQYKFLKMVFEDDHRVFTLASDGSTGHTFSEIYIDAMAKSSKTSQILKDKLLNDRAAAVSMAMICLLVNVGRMNTTLNCE